MGIWGYDAFASDHAYDLLDGLDDLLTARSDGATLRAALRAAGVPCIGYIENGVPIEEQRPVTPISGSATQAALAWLQQQAHAAIRQVRPGGEPHPEITAVAALATIAALRAVIGTGLRVDPDQMEQWALWLETGPAIWTHDPARLAARREVAAALRAGGAIHHTSLGDAIMTMMAPESHL